MDAFGYQNHHFKTTAAGVFFRTPFALCGFFRLHAAVAPQPLAMQRLKRQNFHDAKLLEFSLSIKTQVFNVFFLGRKTKTELKSLRQIYPPSTEVKDFLLFFHSLKSLFLLLRPLVSNWAIPTRCTTSASNRSRTSTVACPGDHVCISTVYKCIRYTICT